MYAKDGNTVDVLYARFGHKSFRVKTITSVEVRSETRRGSSTYFLWWGAALAMVLSSLVARELAWGIGALLAGGAGWQSWNERHAVTTYFLFLVTSTGMTQVFETRDEIEITRLQLAIEDAMRVQVGGIRHE